MESGREAREHGRAVSAMVLATLLWGATFIIVRDSLHDIPPATLVAARFGLASLVWGFALGARGRPAGGRHGNTRAAWIGGLASAPLTAGGYLLQAIGLTATSAGSSAFLTSTGTLFAGLFAWPLLRLRPTPVLGFGIGLALLGSALLGLRSGLRLGPGEAWTLLGALVYALQVVTVARWAPQADAALLTAVQTAATALLVLPFAGDLRVSLGPLDAAGWSRLAYLVVAGSVLAPWLQVVAQRVLPPGRIGLVFSLEPVFALLFALAFGGERFVGRWWVGAALILTAVLIVEGGALREERSNSRRASG